MLQELYDKQVKTSIRECKGQMQNPTIYTPNVIDEEQKRIINHLAEIDAEQRIQNSEIDTLKCGNFENIKVSDTLKVDKIESFSTGKVTFVEPVEISDLTVTNLHIECLCADDSEKFAGQNCDQWKEIINCSCVDDTNKFAGKNCTEWKDIITETYIHKAKDSDCFSGLTCTDWKNIIKTTCVDNAANSTKLDNKTFTEVCEDILSSIPPQPYSGEIDVYCGATCLCTINCDNPLVLSENAFNENAKIDTNTYPGACCTGTLVQSDIQDFITMNDVDQCGYTTCIGTVTSVKTCLNGCESNAVTENGTMSLDITPSLCFDSNSRKICNILGNKTSNEITLPTGINCTGTLVQSDIEDFITMSDVDACGYTTCKGTVTSVNNITPVNGNVTLTLPPDLSSDVTCLRNDVDAIEGKIPTQASTTNQLADKDFVNSSIETATATFVGTFDDVSCLPTTGVDNNDYAFVTTCDSTTGTVSYTRYKYSDYTHTWICEYTINTTGFTAEQLAALNSGITDTLVAKITDVYNPTVCIYSNGTCCGSFTLNQSSNKCIGICNDKVSQTLLDTSANRPLLFASVSITSGACCGVYYNTNITANSNTGVINATLNGLACRAKCNCVITTTCDSTYYPVFSPNNTSSYKYNYTNANLSYNPSTGTLTALCFNGTAKDSTCFAGCTYDCAKADIRSGLTSCIGTVTSVNACLNGTSATAVTTSGTLSLNITPSLSYTANTRALTTTLGNKTSTAITLPEGINCTGTLVASDLNGYATEAWVNACNFQTQAITTIKICNSNKTTVQDALNTLADTFPKKTYVCSYSAAHCRYIYLGKIPVSSGSVAYASLTMYLFGQNCQFAGTAFPIGTIQIDVSSGSSSATDSFNIRGWSDIPLDSETTATSSPRIYVTKDTTNAVYCLWLDDSYNYVRPKIQINQHTNFTIGNLCSYASLSDTSIWNSKDCSEIKYINDLTTCTGTVTGVSLNGCSFTLGTDGVASLTDFKPATAGTADNSTCFNGCTYAQACTNIRSGLCSHDCLVKLADVSSNADRAILQTGNGFTAGCIACVYKSSAVPFTYNACCGCLKIGNFTCNCCNQVYFRCNCGLVRSGPKGGQTDAFFIMKENNCLDNCSLGMGIGSGNVNRGIFDYCTASGATSPTFRWLQYWNANKEIHALPIWGELGADNKVVYSCVAPVPYNTKRYVLVCFDKTCTCNPSQSSAVFEIDDYSSKYFVWIDVSGSPSVAILKTYWQTNGIDPNSNAYGSFCAALPDTTVNGNCFWIAYGGYRAPVIKSARKISIICNTTTAPSGITFTAPTNRNSYINVYCGTSCVCTLQGPASLCLSANAFNTNASISTTTYPGACCVGTVTSVNACLNGTSATAITSSGTLALDITPSLSLSSNNLTVSLGDKTSSGIDLSGYSNDHKVEYMAYSGSQKYPLLFSSALTITCGSAYKVGYSSDCVGYYQPSNGTLFVCCLKTGDPSSCTSSRAGSPGIIHNIGYSDFYYTTPYINFHHNYANANYSARIINSAVGRLDIVVNDLTGCSESPINTKTFSFCTDGYLHGNICGDLCGNASKFGGCTYSQACTDIRSGLLSSYKLNGCTSTGDTLEITPSLSLSDNSLTVSLGNKTSDSISFADYTNDHKVAYTPHASSTKYPLIFSNVTAPTSDSTNNVGYSSGCVGYYQPSNGTLWTCVLRTLNPTACTADCAGIAGIIHSAGYSDYYAATPFIDFHHNNASANFSTRLTADYAGRFVVFVNDATGCTASTKQRCFIFCNNGYLYGNVCGNLCGTASLVCRYTVNTGVQHVLLGADCTASTGTCVRVSNGCPLTYDPETGTLSTTCFCGNVCSPSLNTDCINATCICATCCACVKMLNVQCRVQTDSICSRITYAGELHVETLDFWENGICSTQLGPIVVFSFTGKTDGVKQCALYKTIMERGFLCWEWNLFNPIGIRGSASSDLCGVYLDNIAAGYENDEISYISFRTINKENFRIYKNCNENIIDCSGCPIENLKFSVIIDTI